MPSVDLKFVEEAVERIGRKPTALIPILQALQEHHGYLPREALERLGELTEIRPSAISGVSTFYDMFRHKPAGKHIIRVCRGTACHVAGADRVEEALRRHLRIPPGADTDAAQEFTIERVACLGCCTLAPVVKMGDSTMGFAFAEKSPDQVREYLTRQTEAAGVESTEEMEPAAGNGFAQIHVGLGSCCMAKGSAQLFHALRESAGQCGGQVAIKRVGCMGMCHRTPMIEVALPGQAAAYYSNLTPGQADALMQRHFRPRGFLRRAGRLWTRLLDGLLLEEAAPQQQVERFSMSKRDPGVRAFLENQVHIATEHFGKLDPLDLDEYLAHEGFAALRRCLETPAPKTNGALSPEQLIATLEQSGLRGRGGAGFPSGQKWRAVRQQPGDVKYAICNGDEGDPGAFMDRMILESFPFRVIEGLALAAVAVGAHEGIFYVRHEYPLAVRRVRAAIAEMEKRGWLGATLLGAGFPLRLSVVEGAGAFVCGEETALIASVEGRRGMPRLRPPFPAESGLWGKPTLINNVETLALAPWIVRHGAARFAALGTVKSKGTKVFALAGKIRRGGLIEVPMGTSLRAIVEEIGGGAAEGRRIKAVQIGGPSGGCVPASLMDTPVDYESLREAGAIMGSGGMVVLDDTSCMVDIARYFLQFTQDQSCGKCTFCRVGTKRMLDILDKLCAGKAQRGHLEELEVLARQVSAGSLCGLGKTAPNPVLSTLRYFRGEYEAHLQGRCPAGRCAALVKYRVTAACTGCTLCAQHCPVHAIPMAPYAKHEIDLEVCTRCDTCRKVCPENAIEAA
ncbi:MAG: NAD(P)H-dependent oxidoreductase subunit E [Verrucomicrobiota bacterium]|jgi:NADH:ubiquinone oxidoreductase subunit F (NADH-binding)/NADH:ubiquinone oxidoreductase subunit E/NAD-dependent dihydropyrimidine dehydrogenase PreA subunit